MTAVQKIEASKAWDKRYGLPTCPQFNNPWIYIAYFFLLVRQAGEPIPESWKINLLKFNAGCTKADGTFFRWPDKTGGMASHDEVLGRAYLLSQASKEMLVVFDKTDGTFDAGNDDRKNQQRFIFLRPFMLACTDEYRVSLISQFFWGAHVIISAITYKFGQDSGSLKNWLMVDKMRNYPVSQIASYIFSLIMSKKGCTPKVAGKNYFGEIPEFSEIALDSWVYGRG